MPFIFDLPQQTQIEALYQQGLGTQQDPGAFSPMYDYINNVLITGSPPPTADPVVKQAQLWFSGAKQANSGIGPFAIVIREYTQNQQRLHWGRPAPGGIEPGGLQRASNRVATEVFEDTKFWRPSGPTSVDLADGPPDRAERRHCRRRSAVRYRGQLCRGAAERRMGRRRVASALGRRSELALDLGPVTGFGHACGDCGRHLR